MNPTIVQAHGRTFAWLDDGACYVFVDAGGSRSWSWVPEPRLDVDGRVTGASSSGRRTLLWLEDGRAFMLGISPSLGYQLERVEVADLTVERVEAAVASRLEREHASAQASVAKVEDQLARAKREIKQAAAELARREADAAGLALVVEEAAREAQAVAELAQT